jgi:hypothetical protein
MYDCKNVIKMRCKYKTKATFKKSGFVLLYQSNSYFLFKKSFTSSGAIIDSTNM